MLGIKNLIAQHNEQKCDQVDIVCKWKIAVFSITDFHFDNIQQIIYVLHNDSSVSSRGSEC